MVSGFIERLLEARTIPQIQTVFLEAVGRLGFDHAFYAARFMLTVPRSLLRENPIVFSNLPFELIDGTLDEDRHFWADWVLENDGDIATHDLLGQLGRTAGLGSADDHGLRHAQIISLRDKVLHSHGAVLVFPGAGADYRILADRWRRAGRDVRVLAWVMHMRIATMQRDQTGMTLTPRQREVLTWRSAGKTVSEIAVILGITPATVEKHMRLAREALGVETTPQAVLKAHVTNQLFHPAVTSGTLSGKG